MTDPQEQPAELLSDEDAAELSTDVLDDVAGGVSVDFDPGPLHRH